jgi:hypothetical protein
MLIYFATVCYLATDIVFSFLPILFIRKIRRPMREKLVLGLLMALGLLCSAAVIPKLISLRAFGSNPDFTYNSQGVVVWSALEMYLGIIAVCIPVLRNHFEAGLRRLGFSVTGTTLGNNNISSKRNRHSTGYWEQQAELAGQIARRVSGFPHSRSTTPNATTVRAFNAQVKENRGDGASERSWIDCEGEESWLDLEGDGSPREGPRLAFSEKNILKTVDVNIARGSPTASLIGMAVTR